MLLTVVVICLLVLSPLGFVDGRPAYIVLKSPSPLIIINGEKTYQAIRKESIQFYAELYNAEPLPANKLKYPRLLHSEEHPVEINQECTSEPCILNFTILAYEYADSKYTIRGVDNRGHNATEDLTFYISVREESKVRPPTFQCSSSINDCSGVINGYLIIDTSKISGYPLPHLYYIKNATGGIILNGTLSTDRVSLNLTQNQVNGGGELRLVVENRLGDKTELKIEADFSMEKPSTSLGKSSGAETDEKGSTHLATIVTITLLAVAGAVIVAIVIAAWHWKRHQHFWPIKRCLKKKRKVKAGERLRKTDSSTAPRHDDVENGDNDGERQSLTEADRIDAENADAATEVREIPGRTNGHTISIPPDMEIVIRRAGGQTVVQSKAESLQSDGGIADKYAPSSVGSEVSSITSERSLAQDGPVNPSLQMDELKDHSSSDGSEEDGGGSSLSVPEQDSFDYQRPVQESGTDETCI